MRIAVAQTSAGIGGADARLAWLDQQLDAVAQAGVRLLLLPELFLTGYQPWRPQSELAEPSDGASAARIAMMAKKHSLAIAYGYSERDGDAIYNAAQVFGPNGDRLANHRKIHLAAGFESNAFERGSQPTLFELDGRRFGLLICSDAESPQFPGELKRQRIDALLVPLAQSRRADGTFQSTVPMRARENAIYLASANHVGREKSTVFLGESALLGPDGARLADIPHKAGIFSADFFAKETATAN